VSLYKSNTKCLVCGSDLSDVYLDLGEQPLANSYHKGETLPRFPLQMRRCPSCYHSQLSVSVEPSAMFDHYLYISDTSKTLTDYFKWTTEYILSKLDRKPNNVLEIACNSGMLLEMFAKQGIKSVGIDPAKNLRPLSQERNLDVYVDYWTQDSAQHIVNEQGQFDLILAFHVLPHVPDPNSFIAACVQALAPGGTVFIQTSQCDMFINNEFDVIYHEHTSYFTGQSIKTLARNHGLAVTSIIKTDIHSKSFLFSLERLSTNKSEIQLDQLIADETANGIYSAKKYQDFANNAGLIKYQLTENLARLRAQGYIIIGYGAAAKGNTLLNYINVKLDYIIDDNEMKWGYLTPGTDIEIHGIDLLSKQEFDKIVFVPLAWNFYAEIVERIKKVRNTESDIFVKYFPFYREEK